MFSSCKMSSKKGKQLLDDATQNTTDQITALQSTDFISSVKDFINLDTDPFDGMDKKKSDFINFRKISKIKNLGEKIKKGILKNYPKIFNKKFGSESFSLSKYAGTYTFKPADSSWTYSSTPSDKIIIIFPSKGSSTNDLRFEWTDYKEEKFSDEYYPTVIKAYMYKNNKRIGLIDYQVKWKYASDVYPVSADITLELKPLKYYLEYSFENSIMKINTYISRNARRLDDLVAELKFKANNLDTDVATVKGVFKTYNIKSAVNLSVLLRINFFIDYASMGDEPDCDVVNKNIDIKLYGSSGRYIGKVQCSDDEDDCDASIVFDDGTTESVCTYFDKIEDALDDATDDIEL